MPTENKIFNYISDCIVDTFDTALSIKKEINIHKKFRNERRLNKKKIKNYEVAKKK